MTEVAGKLFALKMLENVRSHPAQCPARLIEMILSAAKVVY